jgi:hypothetical protein
VLGMNDEVPPFQIFHRQESVQNFLLLSPALARAGPEDISFRDNGQPFLGPDEPGR